MATFLVTGAAGFIGAATAEALLARGETVVGLDNLDETYDRRLKEWRLAELQKKSGFRFVPGDIRMPIAALSPLVAGPRYEAVVHLGARAGVRASVEDPFVFFETNTNGTLNLLELCRRLSIPKMVLASSSSLYGRSPIRPSREDQKTDFPISPYAASKKAAEEIGHVYHHLYGLHVTALRYFTVYGPAGRPDMAPFRFVQWTMEGRPLLLSGDGKQERDFTYVDDVVSATLASLSLSGYDIVNVGSDRPLPLLDFIRIIEKAAGRSADIQLLPKHPADVDATWADIGKAKRILGWSPTTSAAEGIERTVSWYRANRDWARDVKTT